MKLARPAVARTALRPALPQSSRVLPAQTRLASTDPQSEVGDKGTAKVYNKDGTNPNKNLIYLGVGALGLGGLYAMFMAKPEKVAATAQKADPEGTARQRTPGSAASR
ncbi:hypothetical protein N657DRAFT_684731 [Parathielavia appendiculata]|uniref:Uncharacterized protein n=1 Tax=Parathielavia appendiculata TaxID=2587402 RepID=A0AAN6TR18_9PEZI|nr:hypothetical protein N657DRAFT_684731 [Parathielavia appendiculata]